MRRTCVKYALTAASFLLTLDANAANRLAIGAAGAGLHPVSVIGRGAARENIDPSNWGFREPIYTTPRGYRYVYVRGYRLVRPVRHLAIEARSVPAKVKKIRI